MIDSLRIENYRCFDDFTIDPLKRVNLIAGPNNIGKTTLLEGLWILQGPYNPAMWLRPNLLRHVQLSDLRRPAENLFHDFNTNRIIRVSGQTEGRKVSYKLRTKPLEQLNNSYADKINKLGGSTSSEGSYGLEVEYRDNIENKPFKAAIRIIKEGETLVAKYEPEPEPEERRYIPNAIFVSDSILEKPSTMLERYGKLETANKEKMILNGLKIIEPGLRKLSIILKNEIPIMHGYVGLKQPLPLNLLGGGMNKIFKYSVNIGSSPEGIVMIDEFENGIHHSVLEKTWKMMMKIAVEVNCQVVATTHSLENIKAAYQAFCNSKYENDFAFHRLFKHDDYIQSTYYRCEALKGAVEAGFDLR